MIDNAPNIIHLVKRAIKWNIKKDLRSVYPLDLVLNCFSDLCIGSNIKRKIKL